jgi:aspartate carbamoyltransferase catalytic subunit
MPDLVAPLKGQSILDVKIFSEEILLPFFERVKIKSFRKNSHATQNQNRETKSVALVFNEPSTRTVSSFHLACHRVGLKPLSLHADSSSMAKGESLEDTVLTLAAMDIDAIVVRHGGEERLVDVSKKTTCPIISGGEGHLHHPTQALLDAYTIWNRTGSLSAQRILFVGDLRHSRVVRSNIELLSQVGAQLGVCAPDDFLLPSSEGASLTRFQSLTEGLNWATCVMALRVQFERHTSQSFDRDRYVPDYQITNSRLDALDKSVLFMHPGPVNKGIELSVEAYSNSRSVILEQVRNGVDVRAQLLAEVCGV